MIRARVLRVALHHAFQRGDDRVGPWFRRAVFLIEALRPQVHHALGEQRGDVVDVGAERQQHTQCGMGDEHGERRRANNLNDSS